MVPDLTDDDELDIDSNDPASKAFRSLRRQVGLMRIALERLVDEPKKIVIPDYTETLVEMTERINAVASRMKALQQAPALELTPETLAAQITAAGAAARKIEQQELASAAATFVRLGSEMAGFLASARTENEQNKWVLGFGGICLAFGLVVATVLPGPIYRAMPDSWHWPEKRAANVLDRDMWDAGERLQAVADPKRWKESLTLARLSEDSRGRIAACLNTTTKGKANVICEVGIKSQAKRRSSH
jgi:Family of unknown function (DUF6118)